MHPAGFQLNCYFKYISSESTQEHHKQKWKFIDEILKNPPFWLLSTILKIKDLNKWVANFIAI